MNEFDQFVLHDLKPLGYVCYGDDFVLWLPDEFLAREARVIGMRFLQDELKLPINRKHDCVQTTHKKLAYLGVELWPRGKRLNKRTYQRTTKKLIIDNAASYYAITTQNLPERYHKRFAHNLFDILEQP